ncbi:hypothetical protein [Hoeflea sp.]|uniref:hypothetical protein n=1 Tax=Hoeflea sp. TaxID=1940281 RepID=UPI003749DBC7
MSKKDKIKKTASEPQDIPLTEAQLAQISQALRSTIVDVAQGDRGIAAQAKRVSVENPKHKTSKVKQKNKAVTSLPEKE